MKRTTDFLVIGSGIAGLSFALHAARYGSVTIITKKSDTDSNTNYAQGGIACVLDPHDSIQSHILDTLTTGKGLSQESVVNILCSEGPDRIAELLEWGVSFTRSSKSSAFMNLDLGKEGGHSANRIVHAQDLTGRAIEHALVAKIRTTPAITMYENHCAVELITQHHCGPKNADPTCFGAYVLDTESGAISAIASRITCTATGGAGRVYLHTTNPEIATGDGIAMAYRAGAKIANMEFIQFHPTTLFHEKADSFLISEAVRGYGGVLKDRHGVEFMKRYHPMGSLAPRDIVAWAIDREMKLSAEPCVFLDIRHLDAAQTRKRFPTIFAQCKKFGIDITRDLVPVVPAAHYLCGGIAVDTSGQSSIKNLYACGEASHTGVHGANRLASNSLLEALVFSLRAAEHAGPRISSLKRQSVRTIPRWDDSGTLDTEEWILLAHNKFEIQTVMWDYVGIVRSTVRLLRAQRRIVMLEQEIEDYYRRTRISAPLLDLRNTVTTARLIVECALRRKESRGLHYTTDYPDVNDRSWKKDTIIQRKVKK